MKNEQIKEYINSLLAIETDEEITAEIPSVITLFSVYMAGLRGDDFPIESLIRIPKIETDIPEPWHVLICQSAILKSKKGSNIARDYIWKSSIKYAKELKNYMLIPH